MSDISANLLWCVIQVTIVCFGASVLAGLPLRWKRAWKARMLHTSLALILGLTVCSLSPWPRWGSVSSPPVSVVEPQPIAAELNLAATTRSFEENAQLSNNNDPRSNRWVRQLLLGLSHAATIVDAAGRSLSAWVLPLLALSLAVGGVRYCYGWKAVIQLVKGSIPVTDPTCLSLLAEMRQRAKCETVKLRESSVIHTPATLGWQQPLILLPNGWRSWSHDELRSVLAHELVHIVRNDFSSLAFAQLNSVFHYYHPLVHAMVANLRLEQEMAADAAAAGLMGGRKKYLSSLVSLALRIDDRHVVWPARCFLPTSGAILRRIEMLKNPQPSAQRYSRLIGATSVFVILVIGIFAAGLRPQVTVAQTKDSQVPSSSQEENAKSAQKSSMNHMKQIGLAMHNYYLKHGRLPPAVIKGPNGVEHSWRVAILPHLGYHDLHSKYDFEKPWDSPGNKQLLNMIPELYRAPGAAENSSDAACFVFVGDGTPFDSDKGIRMEDVKDGTSDTLLVIESKQNVPWTQPKDITYASNQPLPKLGGLHQGGFAAAFVDGAPHFITDQVTDEVLHKVIQRADGKLYKFEELHPEKGPRQR